MCLSIQAKLITVVGENSIEIPKEKSVKIINYLGNFEFTPVDGYTSPTISITKKNQIYHLGSTGLLYITQNPPSNVMGKEGRQTYDPARIPEIIITGQAEINMPGGFLTYEIFTTSDYSSIPKCCCKK